MLVDSYRCPRRSLRRAILGISSASSTATKSSTRCSCSSSSATICARKVCIRRSAPPDTANGDGPPGASFAENFYGLKRRRRPIFETDRAKAAVGGVLPGEKLRGREVWRSLAVLVGLPYLRAKAQDYYEALGGGVDPSVIEGGTDGSERRTADDSVRHLVSPLFREGVLTSSIDRGCQVAATVQDGVSVGEHCVRAVAAAVQHRLLV